MTARHYRARRARAIMILCRRHRATGISRADTAIKNCRQAHATRHRQCPDVRFLTSASWRYRRLMLRRRVAPELGHSRQWAFI